VNAAGVLLSADDGETWTASGELTLPHPADHWVIEGAALELANGTLLLMLRSTEGFIYRSMSADKGTLPPRVSLEANTFSIYVS
jgi:hypothetical protein